jgi:methionyl-tRNA formyltransferase
LRNVYLGTSDFAATVLEKLLDSPHAPSLVVTRPARPKGRGKKLQDPPVAELANERGIPLFQP